MRPQPPYCGAGMFKFVVRVVIEWNDCKFCVHSLKRKSASPVPELLSCDITSATFDRSSPAYVTWLNHDEMSPFDLAPLVILGRWRRL